MRLWCRLNACFLTVENGLQDDLIWEVEREDISLRCSLQFDPHCHTHRKTCTISHGEHNRIQLLASVKSRYFIYICPDWNVLKKSVQLHIQNWWKARENEKRKQERECGPHLLQILAKRLYLGHCESTYNNNNLWCSLHNEQRNVKAKENLYHPLYNKRNVR